MGATTFRQAAQGATAQEAFNNAYNEAVFIHGSEPYSGTIKEKDGFVEIEVPSGEDPISYADQLVREGDSRINDKWGPAGCVRLDEDSYYFFGWASE